MVKFFLPEAKQENPKKRTDYRIIIYKKLLSLIKAKHLKQISNIVKAIKQPENKEIASQEKQLAQLKSIKKRQMKVLVLYVMIQCVKITNLNILEKLANVGCNNEDILKQVQGNKIMKQFIQRVMNSNGYKTKLQQIGKLRDGISKKKHIIKQKSKERKAKKLQKRKQNNESIHGQIDEIQQEENESNQFEEQSENIDKKQNKIKSLQKQQSVVKTVKQNSKQDDRPKNSFWNRTNTINEHVKQDAFKKRYEDKNPNRTEFIKKGRNKVIQQKKERRQKYYKGKQPESKTQAVKPKQKPNQHPSWIAKQEQKKLACITQFQGKKILL